MRQSRSGSTELILMGNKDRRSVYIPEGSGWREVALTINNFIALLGEANKKRLARVKGDFKITEEREAGKPVTYHADDFMVDERDLVVKLPPSDN